MTDRPEGRGRRWTIYVCPECGQRGFEERVAKMEAGSCRYHVGPHPVEVVEADRDRDLEERVASLNATADSLREQVLGRDGEVERLREALTAIRDHGKTHEQPCYAITNGDCADVMQEIARAALAAGPPGGEGEAQ